MICLISCSVSCIAFISFKPCNTNIIQKNCELDYEKFLTSFYCGWHEFVMEIRLKTYIVLCLSGVGATSQVYISVMFLWTPVISSSCPLLKFYSRTSLKNSFPVTYFSEGLLILMENILSLAAVL